MTAVDDGYRTATPEVTMLGFLLPKKDIFALMFDEHAGHCVEAAKKLIDLLEHYEDVPTKVAQIHGIENLADEVSHRVFAILHKSFITPLDRDQIHELISCMDDVIDFIDVAARRMLHFNVERPRPDLIEMAKVLLHAASAMQTAVVHMHDMKHADMILKSTVEINKLENDCDALRDKAVGRLFKEESNAIEVLKWREIYEGVETAVDRCEDVANVIEGIVLENS
jgi:hypothetical protein